MHYAGVLRENHAAQEQLNLLEKSIYTRAIDLKLREKMENQISVRLRARFFIIRPSACATAQRRCGSVRDKK